jgi:hypothetical protein
MQIQLPPVPPVHVTFLTQEPYWWTQWDFWVSVFTFALALMTGWLAWETRALRKDSAKSIKASNATARAAAASVEVAQEAMRRSLRAYVTVQSVNPSMRDAQQIPRAVELILVNTGQTPAIRPELLYHITVLASAPEGQFDPNGPEYYKSLRADLGRDQTIRLHREKYPDDPELEGIRNRSRFMMIYGALRYRDMFTDVERITEFCYGYDTLSQQFNPVGPMNRVS